MDVVWLILGVAIVAATAVDIFKSVIVPRPTGRRLRASVAIGRRAWFAWRSVAARLGPAARERWLGGYAPLLLVGFFGFWVLSFVAGYCLIFYALRAGIKPVPDFGQALYFSATTVLTLGYGDYLPISTAARVVAFMAGMSGLANIAIVTSFLFPIFGAYQSREIFVTVVGNRSGRPPSALRLLELRAWRASGEAFVTTLRDAETWLAQLLETHLAYPILIWFRSTDDAISWIAVVETLLDATSLLLATTDDAATGEAALVHRLGLRFVDEFATYLRLPDGDATFDGAAFDRAYDRLASAGIALRERDVARDAFAATYARYAGRLDVIARYWLIPRARPLGDDDAAG